MGKDVDSTFDVLLIPLPGFFDNRRKPFMTEPYQLEPRRPFTESIGRVIQR